MRQIVTYERSGNRLLSGKVDRFHGDRELMDIQEGLVLRIEEGYREVAALIDGTGFDWTLAVAEGDENWTFDRCPLGYFFPHDEFLPVVVVFDHADLLGYLNFAEMVKRRGDRNPLVDLDDDY